LCSTRSAPWPTMGAPLASRLSPVGLRVSTRVLLALSPTLALAPLTLPALASWCRAPNPSPCPSLNPSPPDRLSKSFTRRLSSRCTAWWTAHSHHSPTPTPTLHSLAQVAAAAAVPVQPQDGRVEALAPHPLVPGARVAGARAAVRAAQGGRRRATLTHTHGGLALIGWR
jgi:hypothetical protein